MHRLQQIAEDLRPILSDRLHAITPAGYAIGELLDEVEALGKKLQKPSLLERITGAKDNDVEPTDPTNNGDTATSGTDEQPTQEPAEVISEAAPRASAARKSNAAQRHAEAIARGEIGKGD